LKIIIVGFGVQGHKRKEIAADDCITIVDPVHPDAQYKSIEAVPKTEFDAAIVSTPDNEKFKIIEYLINAGKHVLVEKPLLFSTQEFQQIKTLLATNNVCCYTAYNHRFEPHFMNMKKILLSQTLGKIYSVRMFYGNGTARLVRNSAWRDQGAGVLPDLGSHLLDTFSYWFNDQTFDFNLTSANCFENNSIDHCTFMSKGDVNFYAEVSLISWKNQFYADIYGEQGSAHIESLCKWGPASFITRNRKLPSGIPEEDVVVLSQKDPTWLAEYEHFKNLCAKAESNINTDCWITKTLTHLESQIDEQ